MASTDFDIKLSCKHDNQLNTLVLTNSIDCLIIEINYRRKSGAEGGDYLLYLENKLKEILNFYTSNLGNINEN